MSTGVVLTPPLASGVPVVSVNSLMLPLTVPVVLTLAPITPSPAPGLPFVIGAAYRNSMLLVVSRSTHWKFSDLLLTEL